MTSYSKEHSRVVCFFIVLVETFARFYPHKGFPAFHCSKKVKNDLFQSYVRIFLRKSLKGCDGTKLVESELRVTS